MIVAAGLIAGLSAVPAQAQVVDGGIEEGTYYHIVGKSWTTGSLTFADYDQPVDLWDTYSGRVLVTVGYDVSRDSNLAYINDTSFSLDFVGGPAGRGSVWGNFSAFGTGTDLLSGGTASGMLQSGYYSDIMEGRLWSAAPMMFTIEKRVGSAYQNPWDTSGLIDIFVTPVPEPATWAMMILGFGAIGGAMRRQRAVRTKLAYS